MPFNLTENLYRTDSSYGNFDAIVMVSPSYTLITIPCVIGGTNLVVCDHSIKGVAGVGVFIFMFIFELDFLIFVENLLISLLIQMK